VTDQDDPQAPSTRCKRFTDLKLGDCSLISVSIRIHKKRGGGHRRITVVVDYDTAEVERVDVEKIAPEEGE